MCGGPLPDRCYDPTRGGLREEHPSLPPLISRWCYPLTKPRWKPGSRGPIEESPVEQPPGMQMGEVGARNTGATGDAQHGSLRSRSCPLLLTTRLWAVERNGGWGVSGPSFSLGLRCLSLASLFLALPCPCLHALSFSPYIHQSLLVSRGSLSKGNWSDRLNLV